VRVRKSLRRLLKTIKVTGMTTQNIYPSSHSILFSILFGRRIAILDIAFLCLQRLRRRVIRPTLKVSFISDDAKPSLYDSLQGWYNHDFKFGSTTYSSTTISGKGNSDAPVLGTFIFRKSTQSSAAIFLERAEDPRFFCMNREPWIYYQILGEKDYEIWIMNLNNHKKYSLLSPTRFNGKNWMPVESYEPGKILFVYSLKPLRIIRFKSLREGCINKGAFNYVTPEDSKKQRFRFGLGNESGFAMQRGGTPLVKIPKTPYFLGFYHVTPNGLTRESHSMGAVLVSMAQNRGKG
jgi:hypothetical protein